jgi:hypothetical protein
MSIAGSSHAHREVAARLIIAATAMSAAFAVEAKEDLEFVQEHLPEVAMDNRYGTLPVWSSTAATDRPFGVSIQTAFSSTGAGNLRMSGPMFAIGAHRRVNERWSVGALAFYDPLRLSCKREQRDLQTLFAPDTPITRPVAAEFSGLEGSAIDLGVGVSVAWRSDAGFLGEHRWIGGVLWQQLELKDYRFDYRIVSGPQSGITGTIDFDAQYAHIVPFAGLELPRDFGRWTTNAHALVAYPLPRRGIVGHITGPKFDIRGDTAEAGNGKHFGDPSVTFGYTVTYEPAHVSFDVGLLLTQGVLESWIHRGIERNILLSFSMGW